MLFNSPLFLFLFLPATVAAYATGTGAWQAYEEAGGAGTEGGTDAIHQMAPTLAGNIPNLVIASPGGGERLVAGEPFTVTWTLPRQAGFQPVKQQLYFSTDGGISFTQLVEDIAGNLEKYNLTMPKVATTTARFRRSQDV